MSVRDRIARALANLPTPFWLLVFDFHHLSGRIFTRCYAQRPDTVVLFIDGEEIEPPVPPTSRQFIFFQEYFLAQKGKEVYRIRGEFYPVQDPEKNDEARNAINKLLESWEIEQYIKICSARLRIETVSAEGTARCKESLILPEIRKPCDKKLARVAEPCHLSKLRLDKLRQAPVQAKLGLGLPKRSLGSGAWPQDVQTPNASLDP